MTFTGYIYKLTGACGKVYIGSTADYDSRLICHKSKSNGTNSRLLLKPIIDEINVIITILLFLIQIILNNSNKSISSFCKFIENLFFIKHLTTLFGYIFFLILF